MSVPSLAPGHLGFPLTASRKPHHEGQVWGLSTVDIMGLCLALMSRFVHPTVGISTSSCKDTALIKCVYEYLPWYTHIYFTTEQSQHILPLFLLGLGLSFGGSNSDLLVIHTPHRPVHRLVTPCQTVCSFLAQLELNLHGLWPCIPLPRPSSLLPSVFVLKYLIQVTRCFLLWKDVHMPSPSSFDKPLTICHSFHSSRDSESLEEVSLFSLDLSQWTSVSLLLLYANPINVRPSLLLSLRCFEWY